MAGSNTVKKTMLVILLSALVVLVGVFSLVSIQRLQGNARVINYAGVVRGATQKLVKEEIQGDRDDALILRLDNIIEELLTGEGDLGLIRLEDADFQNLMNEMKDDWQVLKAEIYAVRRGGTKETLFSLSQDYFVLADSTVSAAERYSQRNADIVEICFVVLIFFVVAVACVLAWYGAVQRKRRRALQLAEEENQAKRERLSRMEKTLQTPMDEISELIYISDVDNYDLLYINEAGKRTFGVKDIQGKKCYKVLQGLDAPCDFCTNCKLKPGENYDWEITNALTKRHYILKDRLIEWNGSNARMEIAFDVTQAETEKQKLKYALDIENRVMECVRILYQSSDLNKAVNQVLRLMGEFLQAERTYVFSIHDDQLFNDYEWCRPGIQPQKEVLQGLPISAIDRWQAEFSRQKCVVVEDLEAYRESSAEEYEIMKAQGINSFVVVPMETNGTLVGFLGVDNPPAEKIANISAPLQTLCYFLLLAYKRTENEKQLSVLSFHDTLTSFYNRNRYIKDLGLLPEQKASIGIVYLDVNGLKEVNDQLGHSQGDSLLVQVANRIKAVFANENCYRVGGDEFVVVAVDITRENFEEKVAELKRGFMHDSQCRAAIGSRWAESAQDLDQIVSEADASMYEDKKAFYRRNKKVGRYRHHSDEVLQLANPDVLQNELEKQQFVVYLQPKISSSDHSAVGAEALIRYLSKDGSLILPGHFLPVLEEAKTVSQMDFYVFDHVCAKIKKWSENGGKKVPISVNFSRYSLVQPNFLDKLKGICQKHGISPEFLEIEITESAGTLEGVDMGGLIAALRSEGFKVTIDDFGVDYANLSMLSAVEFDVLKLDRSLVQDVAENARSREIIRSISEVCKKLGIKLVAGGIEKEEQLQALSACGVELLQGYLFSEPVPMDEYEKEFL